MYPYVSVNDAVLTILYKAWNYLWLDLTTMIIINDCWCIVEYKATSLADYLSGFIRCMVQKALILIGEKRFWTQVVNQTHLWGIINLRVWIAIKIISNALTIKEEVSTSKEIPEINNKDETSHSTRYLTYCNNQAEQSNTGNEN